jgi:CelD/BcsL family acetyltransferase involved in cellulose biosynthesis
MTIAAAPASLKLSLGRRTLWRFERMLVRRRLSLEEGLSGRVPALPPLPDGAAGYQLNAVPVAALDGLKAAFPGLRIFVRQRYRRRFAALDRDFETYLGGFSAKTRSTLRRKVRKLENWEVLSFRTPDDMSDFHSQAREVSARSYQERLLGAGMPDGEETLSEIRALAGRDAVRGWILYVDGRAAAYLYAPAEGDSLIYAHLGYDPDFASFSPGTVLQFEVMRQLMAERRFAWFDFTEGDGQHKRLWATASLDCADLLLLKPTPANLFAGHALNGFDGAVALARRAAGALGLERVVRARLG